LFSFFFEIIKNNTFTNYSKKRTVRNQILQHQKKRKSRKRATPPGKGVPTRKIFKKEQLEINSPTPKK
jgi:hypothetical protein